MTPVEKLQVKNAALRVLHAPGGPLAANTAGNPAAPGNLTLQGAAGNSALQHRAPLELTLIFDTALTKDEVKAAGADIIATLKSADEIFRNVRCNLVIWKSDEEITHNVTAAAVVQMGRCFEDWEQDRAEQENSGETGTASRVKHLEVLMGDLKKFEARSRLLILVTDGKYAVADREALKKNMNPFLYHRIFALISGKVTDGRNLMPRCL